MVGRSAYTRTADQIVYSHKHKLPSDPTRVPLASYHQDAVENASSVSTWKLCKPKSPSFKWCSGTGVQKHEGYQKPNTAPGSSVEYNPTISPSTSRFCRWTVRPHHNLHFAPLQYPAKPFLTPHSIHCLSFPQQPVSNCHLFSPHSTSLRPSPKNLQQSSTQDRQFLVHTTYHFPSPPILSPESR
jgi:hypothetical protein